MGNKFYNDVFFLFFAIIIGVGDNIYGSLVNSTNWNTPEISEVSVSVCTNVVEPIHNCSADDFEKVGHCQLSCLIPLSSCECFTNYGWRYWTTNASEAINIYEGVSNAFPNEAKLMLELSDYNAGHYMCWFQFQDRNISTYDFNIQLSPGINLYDECMQTEQCLALDSVCYKNKCQCVDPYIYLAIDSPFSPACLQGVGSFQPCNTDQQCTLAGANYFCSSENICDCDGSYTDVPDAGTYLCLLPVEIGGSCNYYEECMLHDSFSMCVQDKCQCDDSYVFNQTDDACTYFNSSAVNPGEEDRKLSTGAIIGIAVGCAALLFMIISIAGIFIGRRMGWM